MTVTTDKELTSNWREWKENADDWERFMNDTNGGSNAREWLESTLPAITLLKQFIPGWADRIETDIHEWLVAIQNDVDKRLNDVHDRVAAIAKHERSFDEISQNIQYFQNALGECEVAVDTLTRRRPL